MPRPQKQMPPFPSEEEIAIELVGHYRAREWKAFAEQLEADDFPSVDIMFGGRFWPAIKRWLDLRYQVPIFPVPHDYVDRRRNRAASSAKPKPRGLPQHGVMPFFPDERHLSEAVFGPGNVVRWRQMSHIFERDGLMARDPRFGERRYWPAALAYFDARNGVGPQMGSTRRLPDGEDWNDRDMPLYPSEEEIAALLLGRPELAEFRAVATVLQRHGFPQVDPLIGLRYWRAIRAWLAWRYELGPHRNPTFAHDGPENWEPSPKRPRRGQRFTRGG